MLTALKINKLIDAKNELRLNKGITTILFNRQQQGNLKMEKRFRLMLLRGEFLFLRS